MNLRFAPGGGPFAGQQVLAAAAESREGPRGQGYPEYHTISGN